MKHVIRSIIGITILLLVSCGPSPEQIATMTASAWTSTPPPTNTPVPTATSTPVPYDLAVTIVDESGAPISGAGIVFPESGNGDAVLTNDQGQYIWSNLGGDKASVSVTAQGYIPADQSAALQRGANEVNITLERDVFAFLPSNACGAGESLLYMEDFQDGETDLIHYNDGRVPVPLGEVPDEKGNTVLVHDFTSPTGDYSSYLNQNPTGGFYEFGDAVWRMRFMITQETDWGLGWNTAGPQEFGGITTSQSSYGVYFNTARHAGITRNIWDANGQPVPDAGLGRVDKVLILHPNTWNYLEFSTYQGHLQVWLNGEGVFDIVDASPLPPGAFSIGKGNAGIMYFDAISVCGLNAPFTSMPSPVPAP